MAYQSLYRRYRSGTFGELVGQEHVVAALKNAIVEGRVGHAYLFSGPRGTGKTSTARILGKALNCTDLQPDGEPCTRCESCLSFLAGTSYDLHELDAASNNGVEAIRDLISKVALGSPGRTKVYILDEVHMLTAGAENALLKTLEEPPSHVVFVLATTEPHKVVPTIRSRTQHFEFELLPADKLERHVRWIAQDAGLDVDDSMVDYVLRVGGGSARDTLSALDQVVAAGGVPRDDDAIQVVLAGLAARDSGAVIAAVSEALRAGRDPRVIGETLLARLRDGFLSSMGASLDHCSDAQAAEAKAIATQMGPAAMTRSLEVLGACLVDMRQAPDPRVDLEVALLRLTRPDLDTDLAAVVARLEQLEQLERGMGAGLRASGQDFPKASSTVPAAPAVAVAAVPAVGAAAGRPVEPVASTEPAAPVAPTPPDSLERPRPADQARAELARTRSQAPADSPPRSDTPATTTLGATRGTAATSAATDDSLPLAEPSIPFVDLAAPVLDVPIEAPPPETAGGLAADDAPGVDEIEAAWAQVRSSLPGRAKSRFSGGRFVSSDGSGIVFGLPNAIHRDRCAECVDDVVTALSAHFGRPVKLRIVIDGEAVAPTPRSGQPSAPPRLDDDEEAIDPDELIDAAPDEAGGMELLTEAFPGVEIVEVPPTR